jgi:hypothetical protein
MGSHWYQKLRSAYRPLKIRILLIGESPPDPRSSERRFFYSPVLKADNLYRGVAMALYGRERGFDVTRKIDNLARMKLDGVWLVDAVNTPINLKAPAERKQAIRDGVPDLVKQVKKAAPSLGVIICHGLVYRECANALRAAQISVLHDEALPFPLGNTRARFVAGARHALARAARR